MFGRLVHSTEAFHIERTIVDVCKGLLGVVYVELQMLRVRHWMVALVGVAKVVGEHAANVRHTVQRALVCPTLCDALLATLVGPLGLADGHHIGKEVERVLDQGGGRAPCDNASASEELVGDLQAGEDLVGLVATHPCRSKPDRE